MEKNGSTSLLRIKSIGVTMFIFGLVSLFLVKGLSSIWYSIWHPVLSFFYLLIVKASFVILIFFSSLMFIICGGQLISLRNWARKLAIWSSVVLLAYFIYFILFLFHYVLEPNGLYSFFVGSIIDLFVFVTLPFIIFPLVFIFTLTRHQVKEQFK